LGNITPGQINASGVVTATKFVGDGSSLTNINASVAGINTSTISTFNNINAAGIVTAASFSKFGGTSSQFLKADGSVDNSTYATQSYVGLSTVNLLSSTGSGTNLTGIVTSIIAGTNITVSSSTGEVTINSTASGGGTSSQWTSGATGITTTSSVGIKSTAPTSALDVTGDVKVSGIITATDFNSSSDINLKTNIQTIENPISKLFEINGVTFNWIENEKASVGVIAQDVEKALPQLVNDMGSHKVVNYNGLIGLLVECIKHQQRQIDELKEHMIGS
jgi:hypothetical protein